MVQFKQLVQLVVLIIVFSCFKTLAQQPSLSFDLSDLEKKSEKKLKSPIQEEITPLESKIDPEQYMVGPGDLLKINIRGGMPEDHELRITPEQKLLIPEVGEIDLTGYTLAQARDEISKFLAKRYRNSEFSISLVGLREFRVFVTGAVNAPGSIIVNGNMRVAQAIREAGGFLTVINVKQVTQETEIETPTRNDEISKKSEVKIADEFIQKPASMRNLKLIRKDGTTIPVDYLRFSQGGDPRDNPFLRDGDVIVVPHEQQKVGQIAIWGAVRMPGEFEYIEGDNLENLIIISQGFTADADLSKIEIVRFEEDHQTTKVIPIDLSENSGVKPVDIPLFKDDRIYVRYIPRYHRKAQVDVVGEVQYPGKYQIIEGVTTLAQVIEQAGGCTPRASVIEATLLRKAMEDLEDPEFDRLKEMSVEHMTTQEREYFKVKSREVVGAVSVDFARLIEDGDSSVDVALFDRDEITIPSVSKTIQVIGQVQLPGLVPFVQGKTFEYYLKKAGGYGWNAAEGRVRVIRGQTGEWLKPKKNTEIFLGDRIFVPEKPERDKWELAKDYIQMGYQIAMVIYVFVQAEYLNSKK